jgi:hypothetical protein
MWQIIVSWKILCIGQNHIFQVEIWRNFANQKHWRDDKDPDKVAEIKCLGLF